jgi:hypothetical protein
VGCISGLGRLVANAADNLLVALNQLDVRNNFPSLRPESPSSWSPCSHNAACFRRPISGGRGDLCRHGALLIFDEVITGFRMALEAQAT